MSWVNHNGPKPWKLQFCFSEMKALVSRRLVVFRHVLRSANGWADASTINRGLLSGGFSHITILLGIGLLYPGCP